MHFGQIFRFLGKFEISRFFQKISIFCYFSAISAKNSKKVTPLTFFMKIRYDLKCVRIAPVCSNKVVQRLRTTIRVVLNVHKAQIVSKAMLDELTTFVAKKVVKDTILLQNSRYGHDKCCKLTKHCFWDYLSFMNVQNNSSHASESLDDLIWANWNESNAF